MNHLQRATLGKPSTFTYKVNGTTSVNVCVFYEKHTSYPIWHKLFKLAVDKANLLPALQLTEDEYIMVKIGEHQPAEDAKAAMAKTAVLELRTQTR